MTEPAEDEAERLLAACRAMPDDQDLFRRVGATLRAGRRLGDAGVILLEARRRFPNEVWPLNDTAWLAADVGDFNSVREIGERLRRRFPNTFEGPLLVLVALRRMRRLDEAEAFLAEIPEPFSTSEALLAEGGWIAHDRGDWNTVLDRAEALLREHPESIAGWLMRIGALHRLNRPDEAETVIAEALIRFPDQPGVWSEAAWLARMRGEAEVALERWAAMRRRFPDVPGGYGGALHTLIDLRRYDEAGLLAEQAVQAFPGDLEIKAAAARLADATGDPAEAEARWREVAAADPDNVDAIVAEARALRRLGRPDEAVARLDRLQGRVRSFDIAVLYMHAMTEAGRLEEAEAVCVAAQEAFPDHKELLNDQAWLRARRGNWAGAAEAWAAYREAFPDDVGGYRHGATALENIGDPGAAGRLLREAVERWPEDFDLAYEWARLAGRGPDREEGERRAAAVLARFPDRPEIALEHAMGPIATRDVLRRNYDLTLARLAALNERFPDFVQGWSAHAEVLNVADRLEEAEALAAAAEARFPTDPAVVQIHAAVLRRLDRPSEAVDRLQALQSEAADEQLSLALIGALCQCGRYDEADEVCRAAIEKAPSAALAAERARVARRRGDVNALLERWREARAAHPDDVQIAAEATNDELLNAEAAPSLATATPADGLNPFSRIESLGGTSEGCEFGIVQRRAGIEPLGLLRWTHITAAQLAELLENRFHGVGSKSQTVLDTFAAHNGRSEYRTSDRRYGMVMHTQTYTDEVPEERMLRQSCRRLKFLRDKLVEDLRLGEKLFVFKQGDKLPTEEEIARIVAVIADYGDGVLLHVRHADEAHPSGTVERSGTTLLTGYLDHFTMLPSGEIVEPNMSDWRRICVEALRLRDTEMAKTPEPQLEAAAG